MNYNLQIQKILVKVEETHASDDKIKILKEAIQIADANNDVEWGYDLRIELMDVKNEVSHDNESFAIFAWLLDAHDNNPDLFDENEELLWKYKWMIDSAARNSKITLNQINAIIEDYKIRLQDNGYGLRSYYGIKVGVGFITENDPMVEENIHQRALYERDDMSDSSLHELYDQILYLFTIKQIDAALEKEKDFYLEDMDDSSNLFSINTCYAECLARANRFDLLPKYIDAAETNFALLQKECHLMVSLSSLIFTLTFVDTEKAWSYFEQYAHWINKGEEYDKLVVGLNVLPLLKNGGMRTLQVNSAISWHKEDGAYNIAELYDYYYKQTNELAQCFDTRNCNNSFTKRLKESSQ